METGPSYQFYSIIVPSFNRADEVSEFLKSVSELTFPIDRFEVLVADDGSRDNTETVVREAQETVTYNLRYCSQENKGPGAARNMGMEKARGDFFIFVDSDVTVPADWLSRIDAGLAEHRADAFGGPDTFRHTFPPLLKAINYSMTSFITTGGMRGRKGKRLAKFYPRSFNMGISRTLWQKIGGFGSLRHGQDIEFSHRILQSGANVVFVDTPVYHKRRTNLRRFYKQVFNWGVARINLYKLNREMLEPLHFLPAAATALVLLVLVMAFFFAFFRYLLIIGIGLAVIVFACAMIDAVRIYKDWKPALWLPLVMPAQIIGYGLGFIYNYMRRVIFKKGEEVGFKKNYYK